MFMFGVPSLPSPPTPSPHPLTFPLPLLPFPHLPSSRRHVKGTSVGVSGSRAPLLLIVPILSFSVCLSLISKGGVVRLALSTRLV